MLRIFTLIQKKKGRKLCIRVQFLVEVVVFAVMETSKDESVTSLKLVYLLLCYVEL